MVTGSIPAGLRPVRCGSGESPGALPPARQAPAHGSCTLPAAQHEPAHGSCALPAAQEEPAHDGCAPPAAQQDAEHESCALPAAQHEPAHDGCALPAAQQDPAHDSCALPAAQQEPAQDPADASTGAEGGGGGGQESPAVGGAGAGPEQVGWPGRVASRYWGAFLRGWPTHIGERERERNGGAFTTAEAWAEGLAADAARRAALAGEQALEDSPPRRVTPVRLREAVRARLRSAQLRRLAFDRASAGLADSLEQLEAAQEGCGHAVVGAHTNGLVR